jgi:hypothetical protein
MDCRNPRGRRGNRLAEISGLPYILFSKHSFNNNCNFIRLKSEYPMPLPTMSESNMRKTIFTEIHAKIEQNNAQKGANFEMTHNIFSVMVIIMI